MFESPDDSFDKSRNSITVQYCPSKRLAAIMDSRTPVIFMGNRRLPTIISVQDKNIPSNAFGKESQCTVRSQGFFFIRGRNFR
ncbi:MAG: hypothetical protein IJ828_04115 [Treponema sp.]|nr:hypothetical protein [Treponema sp.]